MISTIVEKKNRKQIEYIVFSLIYIIIYQLQWCSKSDKLTFYRFEESLFIVSKARDSVLNEVCFIHMLGMCTHIYIYIKIGASKEMQWESVGWWIDITVSV